MGTNQDVQDAVFSLVRSVVPTEKRRPAALTRDLHLRRDLGLDSLRLVALVVQFEERLGINLGKAGDIDFARIQTIGDVIDVARRLVERCGSQS
jgi:acyl carrier protein